MSAPEVEQVAQPPEPDQAPPVITIGGRTIVLEEPGALFSVAIGRSRAEIEAQDFTATLAYGAAAILECWPRNTAFLVAPRPRAWGPGRSALDHGREVYEALRRATRGRVARQVLHGWLVEAHNWAVNAGITDADIAAAADFSAAPAGD
jgi:hypothetical protein